MGIGGGGKPTVDLGPLPGYASARTMRSLADDERGETRSVVPPLPLRCWTLGQSRGPMNDPLHILGGRESNKGVRFLFQPTTIVAQLSMVRPGLVYPTMRAVGCEEANTFWLPWNVCMDLLQPIEPKPTNL